MVCEPDETKTQESIALAHSLFPNAQIGTFFDKPVNFETATRIPVTAETQKILSAISNIG